MKANDQTTLEATVQNHIDRRVAPRKELMKELSMSTDDNFYTGFTEDISEGGLFVCTHELLPVGTQVQISLELPGGHRIEGFGRVRWVRDPHDPVEVAPGMGIQFEALSDADQEAVREFMQNREPLFYDHQ